MKFVIKEPVNNITIYEYLQTFHISIHLLNDYFSKGLVYINETSTKQNTIVKQNDLITLDIDNDINMVPYKRKIDILYEDDYLLVVNKPKSILIHDDGKTTDTLTNMAYFYLSKKTKHPFVYPIHRLDYDTTGIVVFAKDRLSLSFLSYEIEMHHLVKEYACLCYNKFKKLNGIINSPIGKDRHSNKQIVCKNGKTSQSSYQVIKNGPISKVYVTIKHGRKHQIRVHLSSINHPIVGDKLYGKDDNESLKLHFRRVEFTHPITRKRLEIICEEQF